MNNILNLILAFFTGSLLGALFFGGLWWTIQKGISSKNPSIWFFSSLLLRTGITMTGFYFIGRGHGERLLICLLGFIIARLIVKKYFGTPGESLKPLRKEEKHAS